MADQEKRIRYLPVDIASLCAFGVQKNADSFFWPSSPEEYDIIAGSNLDVLYDIFKNSGHQEKTIIKLKFRDIFTDFNYLITDWLDVQKSKNAGFQPLSSIHSYVYKNLIAGKAPPLPISTARMKKSFQRQIKDILKGLVRRGSFRAKDGQSLYFTTGAGHLAGSWAKARGITPITLDSYYFSSCPNFNFHLKQVDTLASTIHSAWIEIINKTGVKCSTDILSYLLQLVQYHLSWAYRDINTRPPFPLGNTVFLSGTGGSYRNRLIGFKTQEAGGYVIRFDHGGERPFHSDKWWGINEFVSCNEFIAFSPHAARAVKRKIESGMIQTLLDNPDDLKVADSQSAHFHSLALKYGSLPPPENLRRVMFVPTGFQDECNSTPSFTNHDIPYADFQIQILEILKRSKHKVLYKEAPKVKIGKLFSSSLKEVEIVCGFLSESLELADALVFTFIGTAFCEALCTNKPIILLQAPPSRPMSQEEKSSLSQVCRVIPCAIDGENRLLPDRKSLINAIVPMTGPEIDARKKFREQWLL